MIASRPQLLLAFGVYTLLTLAWSWPLPLHMERWIAAGDLAVDPLHTFYGVLSGAQALGDHPHRYFDAAFFYPHTSSLAFLDNMFVLAAISAPVVWLTGNMVLGYNVAWVLTFTLCGVGTFLLVRYLTEDTVAALLAGAVFTFYPFRTENVGLINVLALMWIPFALLSFHVWLETRSRRHAVFFLGFCLLQALTSGYGAVFLEIAVLIGVAVLLAAARRPFLELVYDHRAVWGIGLVLATLALFPFVTPYLRDVGLEEGSSALAKAAAAGARPGDWLTAVSGSADARLLPGGGRYPLFPGFAVLALAGAFLAARGWRGRAQRTHTLFYALLAAAAWMLALGPEGWVGDTRIPLPFAGAYYVLPGVSFVHTPVRFALLVSLALAVLAGLGWAWCRRRGTPAWGLAGIGAVLVAELVAPGPGRVPVFPEGIPPVYRWISGARSQVIAELPMPPDEPGERPLHARYQLYALAHKQRLVNGVAAGVPRTTRDLRRSMTGFPDPGSVGALRDLGVSYVLVHPAGFTPRERNALFRAIRTYPGVHLVRADPAVWLLDVVPPGVPGE